MKIFGTISAVIALAFCTTISTEATAQSTENGQSTENVQKQDKRNHKRGHKNMSPKKRVEKMAKSLNLDEKQQEQLLTYYTEQEELRKANRPERGEMKEGEKPSKPTEEQMAARKAEMEAQRAAEDAKLKSILTDEQYAKLQEMRNKQPEMGEGGPHFDGPKGDRNGKERHKRGQKQEAE